MKSFLLLIVSAVILTAGAAAADWTADYARLLGKYATPNGVKYAAWKANPDDMKAIESVVQGIAAAPSPGAKNKEALAFYINAYNAWILREALAKYPTKSVKDTLFTFFTTNRITVAGEKMSFNRLEKDIIRPRFDEPRIHFALNCASRSCPPLIAEPFSAPKLETQLETLSKAFVNSDRGVRPTKDGAALSMIFDWYKEDFGPAGSVVAFINKRRNPPLPANAKITYQPYDWGLNEVK